MRDATAPSKASPQEVEIVAGDCSYEVQIDFDRDRATKVDVITNIWEADATDRALHRKEAK